MLRFAILAAATSTGISIFVYMAFPLLGIATSGGWVSWAICGVLALASRPVGRVLVRFGQAHFRRLALKGEATVGRLCAELIAIVAVCGFPAVWSAMRQLRESWAYGTQFFNGPGDHAFGPAAVAVGAVCIIGIVWALCARDELPREPLFPPPPPREPHGPGPTDSDANAS